MNGRKEDIGAFDTPKNPGQAIGWVTKVGPDFVELEVSNPATILHNGDGLCYYDIVRGGMDKGVGLADLCEKMGLTLADAVAAGDSANDVAMLKAAGLGCCMANGTPDAKAAADRIIGDVREDGLADLIEELWFDGPRAEPSGRDLGSPWDKIESAGGQ